MYSNEARRGSEGDVAVKCPPAGGEKMKARRLTERYAPAMGAKAGSPDTVAKQQEIALGATSSPQGKSVGLAAPGGGLAARRNFKGGPIAVETGAAKKETGTAKRDGAAPAKPQGKRIRYCRSLKARYEIGKEVMASCHLGMKVLFGKQIGTGLAVVIKVRQKKNSFKVGEERDWRSSMEFMMNLPPCGNIAKLYEVLEDAVNYYVIMEECKGQDLFECLHSAQGKLKPEEVMEVLSQILTALASLHAEGIIHKDLKLENVMLDRTPSTAHSVSKVWSEKGSENGGEVGSPLIAKLVDFDTVEEWTPKSPKAKDVMGTDQYISQEAYAGNYSFASDIFAVGVIGYRLLVGRFPFDKRLFDDEPGENWVGSPKMKEIREKLCNYQINWNHEVFRRQPQAMDLLKSMLAMDEKMRPTAEAAAAHAWFSSYRGAIHSGAGSIESNALPHCIETTHV